MTQGGPLSSKIFNVVVYVVLRHWATVVELTEESVDPGAADTEVFSRDVQHIAANFYADDGILAFTWVACLQRAFTTLT